MAWLRPRAAPATNPTVQQIMLGGIAWTMGNVEVDVKPNIAKVTPEAGKSTR